MINWKNKLSFGKKIEVTKGGIVQRSILRRSFIYAGVLFVATCLIGIFTKLIVERTTSFNPSSSRFSFSFWNDLNATPRIIFIVGIVCILISMVMSLVWAFRVLKVSKTFIVLNYIIFALAQGIGFGSLFLVFNAFELLSIFGIAGGIFLAMGLIGFLIKDGTRLLPFIIWGSILVMILSLVSLILYLVGVYSDTFVMFTLTLSGVMFLIYIIYDIWTIRKTSQYQELTNNFDQDTQFRLVSWFGFRLASDLIGLIWHVARFYFRFSR